MGKLNTLVQVPKQDAKMKENTEKQRKNCRNRPKKTQIHKKNKKIKIDSHTEKKIKVDVRKYTKHTSTKLNDKKTKKQQSKKKRENKKKDNKNPKKPSKSKHSQTLKTKREDQ